MKKMAEPLFSVVIPTHNRSTLLPIALQSVLGQSFEDFEIVVIDDASSDSTPAVLASYTDSRLVVRRSDRPLRTCGARNLGLSSARGRYVCFLDDDDYYRPSHLETLREAIARLEFPVAMFFTLSGQRKRGDSLWAGPVLPPMGNLHPVAYLFDYRHPICTPQACIHGAIGREVQFDERLEVGMEDTEFFMRVAARYPVHRVEASTYVYVQHDGASAHFSNNSGRGRLATCRRIFDNPELGPHIPWRLRREVLAYAYHRMADHYLFVGRKGAAYVALIQSIRSAPWDGQLKIRLVTLLYALPGGGIVSRVVRALKRLLRRPPSL